MMTPITVDNFTANGEGFLLHFLIENSDQQSRFRFLSERQRLFLSGPCKRSQLLAALQFGCNWIGETQWFISQRKMPNVCLQVCFLTEGSRCCRESRYLSVNIVTMGQALMTKRPHHNRTSQIHLFWEWIESETRPSKHLLRHLWNHSESRAEDR
jgi:hypothetical protein